MRVLLVDDESELVSALAERLSFRGIEADWSSKCYDALTQMERKKYDLAVLDMKMPKMNGIELKKKMQEKFPDMKFIFMTGHGSEDNYRAGSAEAGADYFLVKPVDIDTLVEKMNEVLHK